MLSLCIIHGIVICSFFTLNKKKSKWPPAPEKPDVSGGRGDKMEEGLGEEEGGKEKRGEKQM